jgi:H+-translocating NAD(P) transhydrogenase subunit beta
MQPLLTVCYLFGSITFILGLKMLSNPATARKGNWLAAIGMFTAIAVTIFLYKTPEGKHLQNLSWILLALILGTIVGTIAAKKVQMTAMPEMVSLFNGMGGACAALISIIEFRHIFKNHYGFIKCKDCLSNLTQHNFFLTDYIIIFLGLIIGTISFIGSMVAWGKLNGKIKDRSFKFQHIFNLILFSLIILLSIYNVGFELRDYKFFNLGEIIFYSIFLLSLLYGIFFVLPIGGADMPVVISLLNSFTGVAAACGGFLYDNTVMLTGGILVGAAGTLLTLLMCKAMNRSLKNVLIGNFGGNNANNASNESSPQGNYKEISINDTATVLAYANKVVIVPGYGLAVAQAQHTCHELEKLLSEKGVEVLYAIHPVAGRMPGHMNVLLAEADVSYDKLKEMEEINNDFKNTDVVLILGANDVVNPAAKNNPSSPIYGMPILEVEQAKTIIVNKRSMKPGYAGIENELFFQPKTSMLFGDAKKALQEVISELKNV